MSEAKNLPVKDTDAIEVAAQAGITDLDLSAEELIEEAGQDIGRAMQYAVKAGIRLIVARNKIEFGGRPPNSIEYSPSRGKENTEFNSLLEKNGIDKERGAEVMRIAHLYIQSPANRRRSLFSMGKSKTLALASLPQDEIDRLSTEEWDEFSALSYRVLRQKLKKSDERVNDLERERLARPENPVPFVAVRDSVGAVKARRYANMLHEWGNNASQSADHALRAIGGIPEPEERRKAFAYLAMSAASAFREIKDAYESIRENLGDPVKPEETIVDFTKEETDSMIIDFETIKSDIAERIARAEIVFEGALPKIVKGNTKLSKK